MTFVLLVSFIIAVFVIFLDYFVGYIQSEYAAKRPLLESWGLNTDSWLGSVHHRRNRDTSLVIDAISCQEPNRVEGGLHIGNDTSRYRKTRLLEISKSENDFISKEIYNDFLSPREECIRLMTRVQEFLTNDGIITNTRNKKVSQDAGGLSSEHLSAVKAISGQLMINYDGTLKPLNCRQRIFCKDRQDLIEKKIEIARIKSLKICESINSMEVYDDNLKDIALMRKFILEQVSIFYRFSLNRNFADIDGVPPDPIRPILWLLAWTFISCVLLFFFYWIFLWGVQNGGTTLYSWGTNYGVSIFQDCFVCEIGKICIMYVFAIMSAKPQLQVIKRIINDRALSLVQDGAEFNDKVSVVQHFSPSCRAARMSGLSKLPASAILRSMTDADVEKCKEHKNFTLGSIIFYTIMMAAIIAAVSEVLVDQFLSCILASSLLGFLLLHTQLIAISPFLVVGIYALIFGITLYHLLIFVPSVSRARQARHKRAKAAREFARSKLNGKKTHTTLRDFLRRLKKLNDYFLEFAGRWHTILSNEGAEVKKEKDMHDETIWCGMNRPSNDQGYVASQSEVVMRFKSPDCRYSNNIGGFGNDSDRTVDCIIPTLILIMRQTGSVFNGEIISHSNADEISTQISPFSGLQMSKKNFPTIEVRSNRGKLARMYLANVQVTTDPEIALKRMLERHLLGKESHKNGEECNTFDVEDAVDDFIFMSELNEMLTWTWGTFYPGGKELSNEIRLEVDDLFKRWKKSPSRLLSCCNRYPDGLSGKWGANFSEFSEWFHSICNDIEFHCIIPRQSDEYTALKSTFNILEHAHTTGTDSDSDCQGSVYSLTSKSSERNFDSDS